MPFNKSISGYKNEEEFVEYLNGKKVKELDFLFLLFIEDLFESVKADDVIICYKNSKLEKSDIFISINNDVKGISIKKGIKNSVHVEGISDFIYFLIENNISRDNVIEYLKYHYADGSTNGSGKNRISSVEYKKDHQDKLDQINKEINNSELLLKAVDRFIIKGRNSNVFISALLYGVVDDFIWIKSDDIRNIILNKKDVYSSSIHFGPLTCQPLDRCLNKNWIYEGKRYCVQIKWYNIFDDIIENMNNSLI